MANKKQKNNQPIIKKKRNFGLWWRNLGKAGQITLCSILGVAVATAVAVPIVITVTTKVKEEEKEKEEKREIVIDSSEVTVTHSYDSEGNVKGNIRATEDEKDILELEVYIGDYKLGKYEFKYDQETGDFEIYADIIKEHKGKIKITPKFTEKKVRTFLFPQTIVNDPSIELMAAGADKQDEEYFKFNNVYYVRDTAAPYEESGFTPYFSNGIKVEKGTKYYFKCENIDWQIKESKENYSTFMSKKVLYARAYDSSGKTSLDKAEIKTWLDNYFCNNVFKDVTDIISPYTNTDFQAGVTNAKVWIPNAKEIGTWDSEKTNRIKEVTDFAICNGAKYVTKDEKNFGFYWTRTDSGVELSAPTNGGDCLDIIDNNGAILGTSTGPTDKNIGVVTCVNIFNEEL